MTRFERVLQILDDAIGGPNVNIGVHMAFWRGLTRDEFVAKNVFGVSLVVLNAGAASGLIKALKGETPFGVDLPDPPAGAQFSRMPAGLDPVSEEDIAFIEQWIDDGCPDEVVTPVPPPEPSPEPPPAGSLSWRPTNAPVASSRTDDIWFLDANTGWAANSDGTIVKTTDGGNSWTVQLHEPAVYFRCLGFASATKGWAGTLTGAKRLFHTKDGGQTWTQSTNLPSLAPSAICGISVVDENVAFASGTNYAIRPARMMKTIDGGQTWTAWEMKPWADLLVDCYFTSPSEGWVVGGKEPADAPSTPPARQRDHIKPVVLQTTDGGQTWINRVANLEKEFPLGEWGWKIQFLDDQIGFIALENLDAGAILKTIDGGETWTRHPINDPQKNANLEGIGFVDANHGWVGGWGDAQFQRRSSSETFDGGLNWHDANHIGRGINRFRFFGNPVNLGYASGETVYKYTSEPVPAFAAAIAGPKQGKLFPELEPVESRGSVSVTIAVPAGTSQLSVRIWERFGELVKTLVDETKPTKGTRQMTWNRTDDSGQELPPGWFIWRVTADDQSESRLIQVK
jgi:photosystem II stability/assembly factor-like uncharacterized protein